MNECRAQVAWKRNGENFLDRRYSRKHEWRFDGGVQIVASSSPLMVPEPYSIANAVDPEEALVASASSCHMLWFLSLAASRGLVVESYLDDAWGAIAKNQKGTEAFTRITLRPRIEFSGDRLPSREDLDSLHRAAHERCLIANSLKCDVVVDMAGEAGRPG